ncbi:hypothetical protein RsTz2092_04130 [Deferribacterales bacterium RsTz2092]|nr:hypothetical protein AGMMS49941_08320 [Deferribacterales bacterium]
MAQTGSISDKITNEIADNAILLHAGRKAHRDVYMVMQREALELPAPIFL